MVHAQRHAVGQFAVRVAAVEREAQVAAIESLSPDDVFLIAPHLGEVIHGVHVVSVDTAVSIRQRHPLRSERVVEQVEVHGELQQVEEVLIAIDLALFVQGQIRVVECRVRLADEVKEFVQRLFAFHGYCLVFHCDCAVMAHRGRSSPRGSAHAAFSSCRNSM